MRPGELWGVELVGVEALAEEGGPVVGGDCVQAGDDVFKGVGNDFGRSGVAAEAVEGGDEIIEAFLAFGLLADGGVDLHPEKVAFGCSSRCCDASCRRDRRREYRIWAAVAVSCRSRQVRPGRASLKSASMVARRSRKTGGAPDAGAGGEDVAEVVGEAFVDPEEITLHGLLVVGRGEAGGAAIFAVPASG